MPKQLVNLIKNGLLPLLLGCGLFFINIKDSHDWGDDFAQYLQQAENLEQGLPLGASPYIQNPDFLLIGPKAYPPGFPLLLCVSNTLFQNEIVGGQYLISFFLLLAGWIFFLLLKRFKVPYFLSLMLMLSFIYHPWILEQKAQLLSDIPFTFFVLLSCLLADFKKKLSYFLLAGLAAGMAISIRSVGWVIPLAGLATTAYFSFKSKGFDKKYGLFTLVTIISALAINLLAGYNGISGGYSSQIGNEARLIPTFIRHLEDYTTGLNYFIEIEVNHWHGFMLILQLLFWIGLLFGILRMRKEQTFITVFTSGYLLLIIIFPFTGGFRFLLPVIPLIILLSATGFPRLFKWQSSIAILMLIILNVAYQPFRAYIIKQENQMVVGPQTPEAKELFSFIQNNLAEDDIVVFSKPRALGYYTHVKTAATLWEIDQEQFIKQTEELGATHYLHYTEIEYFALNTFVDSTGQELQSIFHNAKFSLYKKTKPKE